jgi:hypothetical protein
MTFRLVAVACTALFLMGCGNGKPETVPAGGKVMFNKTTPPVGALIVLHPTDANFEKRIGGKPYARVKDDGSFTLSTYGEDDGAPEGEYGVTADWRGDPKAPKKGFAMGSGEGEGSPSGSPRLKPQFSNPQQPFTKVIVKKGDANEFILEVN